MAGIGLWENCTVAFLKVGRIIETKQFGFWPTVTGYV